MPIKIIDNKKLDLTDDEFDLYKQICRSYDRNNFKGEELFRDLFETDQDGVIIFIRPPSSRHCSMEIFMFIISIMHHQHIRKMHEQVNDLCNQLKEKFKDLKS